MGSPPDLAGAPAPAAVKGKRAVSFKPKKKLKDPCSSSSSSSNLLHGGVRLRRRRGQLVFKGGGVKSDDGDGDGDIQDLGLPLGMSFAAILSKVLDGKNASRERMHVDQLSQICTSAVKESLQIIYGERFDHFMRNFEKSFGSTLMTLRLINDASDSSEQTEEIFHGQGNATSAAFLSSDCEAGDNFRTFGSSSDVQELQENRKVNSPPNQLVLHGPVNQLAHVSQNLSGHSFNHSILGTIEKSVVEQSRSNDLKAVEIGLIMRKLEMKQSQLALSSYANYLDKIKIYMGISKASFREEKLRNEMRDMRNIQLLRTCNDLLFSGVVFMLVFLFRGVYVYSADKIKEASSFCSSSPKAAKSWNPFSSVTSVSFILRCQAQVYTRMMFGIAIILFVLYQLFQRSAIIGPTMPVTFIIVLLGAVCGFAGKFSVDTFGGNGYCWLLYWEALCLLHFLSNAFPSKFYRVLHGPVLVSEGTRGRIIPYWFRRFTYYSIMVLILPLLSGLLPFASRDDWKGYFMGNSMLPGVNYENGEL